MEAVDLQERSEDQETCIQAAQAARVAKLCADVPADALLFSVRAPDGQTWELRLNGSCTGFPPGAVVLNHASPLVNRLFGEMLAPVDLASGQQG